MEKQQFIYVLKLKGNLLDEDNWSKVEEEIVERHFNFLNTLEDEGKLIVAGRTLVLDENNFGIVILNVGDEESARILMENDPAVREGIMTGSLHLFNTILISEKNRK